MDFIRSSSEKRNLWPVEHFFPPVFFQISADLESGMVRGSFFRKYFLWNPYFNLHCWSWWHQGTIHISPDTARWNNQVCPTSISLWNRTNTVNRIFENKNPSLLHNLGQPYHLHPLWGVLPEDCQDSVLLFFACVGLGWILLFHWWSTKRGPCKGFAL